MKILLTGGAGFVGSVLLPKLLGEGYQVKVLDNLMYGGQGLLPHFINKNFEFIRGDIQDSDIVKESISDVDLIIHLAAIVGYPACKKQPELAKAVNLDATVNLDKSRSKNQPVIFASTISNYGSVETGFCTEDTPLNPLTLYGETKTKAERQLLDSGNVVAYRFATAVGLSPRLRLDLLVNDFVYQALKNKQLIVYEKHFKRAFVHVTDMARAIIFAIENFSRMADDVYNIGSEAMNFTKEEIALMIREKVDYLLHFADVGEDPDKRNYEVSYQKIRSLGFETQISMEEAIDELVRGLQIIDVRNLYSNV
ncbi:MAG: NAD-dependent epimerase/dehydratase family protein [Candidatus Poribacteria bacterium]